MAGLAALCRAWNRFTFVECSSATNDRHVGIIVQVVAQLARQQKLMNERALYHLEVCIEEARKRECMAQKPLSCVLLCCTLCCFLCSYSICPFWDAEAGHANAVRPCADR